MLSHQDSINEIAKVIGKGNSLLVVGAGINVSLGYPAWRDLPTLLKGELLPEYDTYNEDVHHSIPEYIEGLKKTLHDQGRADNYYEYLRVTFGPTANRFDDTHLTLVRMPFCGIATTNFEPVIENAAKQVLLEDGLHPDCDAIDLCDPQTYEVFSFVRGLSHNKQRQSILHLHGYYRDPHNIVLSHEDYQKRYRVLISSDQGSVTGILGTPHQKVIYALSLAHPFVFVGYGLGDPSLMELLESVKTDFGRGRPVNYAILPYQRKPRISEEDVAKDQELKSRKLNAFGVMPIYYDVVELPDGSFNYQEGLKKTINDIAEAVGTPMPTSKINELTKKLLKK